MVALFDFLRREDIADAIDAFALQEVEKIVCFFPSLFVIGISEFDLRGHARGVAIGLPVLQGAVVVDGNEAVIGKKDVDVDGADDVHLAMVGRQEEVRVLERSRIDGGLDDVEEPFGVEVDARCH